MLVGKCPICAKRSEADFRPFCSARCADVDLHRWLSGAYSIGDSPQDSSPPLDFEPEEGAA